MTLIKENFNFEDLFINLFDYKLTCKNLLRELKETNGFIAGGFARQVLKFKLGLTTKDQLKRFLDFQSHDIDLFFQDKMYFNKYDSFLKDQFKQPIVETDFASTYYVNLTNFNSIKLQLIQCVLGQPDEILNSFDITNCKVCVFTDQIIYDERILSLEKNRLINVDHWTNKMVFERILKYINYNNFTLNKASIKELPNALMNVLENYDTHKDQFSDFVQNKGMLLSAINQLVIDKAHYFNMIELIKIASVIASSIHAKGYNAMTVIGKSLEHKQNFKNLDL